MISSGAQADAQAKARRPGFLEQLFGSSSSAQKKTERRRSLFGSNEDEVGVRKASSKSRQPVADADPEGDPGLGMGNLTYVPPKLVPLSGIKLTGTRPEDQASAAVYDQLSGSGPALHVLPAAREALVAQYAAQNYRPFWFTNGKLSERGAAVLKLLAAAGTEGLEPQTYLPGGLSAFDAPVPADDPAAMARFDIDLTGAALRYARDASGGQFDPALLSRYHDVSPPWVPAAQAVKMLALSPFAAEYLKSLNPTHPAYAAMKSTLAELRAADGKPALNPVADGKIVKKGEADERIPAVRSRLDQLGYDVAASEPVDPDLLDAELSVQLRLFQKAAGIKVTGALGPQTVAALNTDGTRRSIDKLLDNMERVRWLPSNLGGRYVFVNQPAYQAQVIRNGKPEWTTRVIVGKPDTQTPVFNDEMEFVVFNPSWGVPPSIIANEYLPKLRRDPAYLDKLGFKVVTQQGKVVPSRSIRWSSYGRKIPYGIQQPPGAKNALGELKFLFPNTHNIYMHDTPFRELFERDVRAFSHGCVRVQNPQEFASVVLGWSPEQIADKVASPESETVRLKQKLPVHIAYFTAWPDETGKIDYFSDIYGRDKALETARSATLVAQR
ncbi:L,D-transpeptidase family protein [Aestuariivirga sp.]|uniref:L,D-transpeptidase family protein n=1 Tax=Aestuariivirga sp. TaxID=2650926 RepID=UPI003BA980EA